MIVHRVQQTMLRARSSSIDRERVAIGGHRADRLVAKHPVPAYVTARTAETDAIVMSRLKHQLRTSSLNLTADDIAAAEAVGCIFQPLPPSQLSRFAMQRKIFYIEDEPVLATRGGGLYETAATLSGLLEFGRERIRAGLIPRPAATLVVHETAAADVEARSADLDPITPPEAEADEAAKSEQSVEKRIRRTAQARSIRKLEQAQVVKPLDAAEGTEQGSVPPVPEPASAVSPARRSCRTRESREPKWMTAGADRRGRASVHWSTRQK